MRFTHLKLENWRNFRSVDVALRERMFVFGANAAGKSNLLDVFRFLRDLAVEGGGLRRAIDEERGGFKYVRSLHARNPARVSIDVTALVEEESWRYVLELEAERKKPIALGVHVAKEQVYRNDELILDRPDTEDKTDPKRCEQTHLEQVNANREFRPLVEFLASTEYVHIVPQILRDPERGGGGTSRDPFGGDFLEQIARKPKKKRDSMLRKIQSALKVAVPEFGELTFERDEVGRPHLKARYTHWRPQGAWQREEHFSDGTLRLFGTLWALLDGESPLLLEEPELSLHAAVIRQLPRIIERVNRKSRRQTFVSTHSAEMLNARDIDPSEILLLLPDAEGTQVVPANMEKTLEALSAAGAPLGDALVGKTKPKRIDQLSLFDG